MTRTGYKLMMLDSMYGFHASWCLKHRTLWSACPCSGVDAMVRGEQYCDRIWLPNQCCMFKPNAREWTRKGVTAL